MGCFSFDIRISNFRGQVPRLRCPAVVNFDHTDADAKVSSGQQRGAVFNVEDEVALRESQGLKIRELSKAQQLAEENKQLIIQKWHEHLE